MSLYLITFQMDSTERSHTMVNCIKEYGLWARVTLSTWYIKSENTTTAKIRDNLNSKCPLNDSERLMVVDITNSPWASYYLPREVAEWIKDK